MLAYDRLRRAHFLHFSSLAKTIFLCLQKPKNLLTIENMLVYELVRHAFLAPQSGAHIIAPHRQSGTIRYNQVQSGTIKYHQVLSGTIRYHQGPLYQVPVYQVYLEDQDQISGATYISDVIFNQSFK